MRTIIHVRRQTISKMLQGVFCKTSRQKIKITGHSQNIFNDAYVLLYPTLVKIIVKRDWTASYIVNRVSLVNATTVLSPFMMVDLTEEDVALIQQDHEDLLNASLLSTSEVKETHIQLIASMPTDLKVFMVMPNRFANLIFALFPLS